MEIFVWTIAWTIYSVGFFLTFWFMRANGREQGLTLISSLLWFIRTPIVVAYRVSQLLKEKEKPYEPPMTRQQADSAGYLDIINSKYRSLK